MKIRTVLFHLIYTFILSFYPSSIDGGWDPKTCLDKEKISSFDVLQDSQFLDLKREVLGFLRNSWCTEEKTNLIMDLIALTQPKICVEIGTFTGYSFFPIVSTLSFLGEGKAYAIDALSNFEAVKGIAKSDPHYKWWLTVNMVQVHELFSKRMELLPLTPFYTSIWTPSRNAVSQFDQIDFLHLDGNFSEEGSCEDALLYLPKVKSGGYILLSNLFLTVDNQYPKMKSLWILLDQCEIIAEIENSNAVLFQKN